MGCVQQAVLEFDEEVRAPWRPRLVPDTGTDLPRVRPSSRHTPSRVAVCAPPGPPGARMHPRRRGAGQAPRTAATSDASTRRVQGRAGSATHAARVGSATHAGRAGLRLTRRARRLVFVLAVAGGVALGLWLAPLVGAGGQLRLAGESSVVVQQGDTLWSIAATVAGQDDDVRAVVDEIQRVNGLHGSDLVPGQVLSLPRGGL